MVVVRITGNKGITSLRFIIKLTNNHMHSYYYRVFAKDEDKVSDYNEEVNIIPAFGFKFYNNIQPSPLPGKRMRFTS